MQVLNIFHVLIAIAIVALVLVQRGAGATAGAAFGSGASGTVFGSRGAGNFLTRSTWILGTLFCAISLTMAVVVSRSATSPETDLGVVASVPAAAEQPGDQPGDQPGATAVEEAPTDLPPVSAPVDAGEAPADGDLPAFEEDGAAPGETAAPGGSEPAGDDA